MVVISKSIWEVYFTDFNFLVCYITLMISMLYLHRKEKLIYRLFFTILSVPSLAFTLDTICDAYYLIPFKSLQNFEAYIIFLSPLFLYLIFLYRFQNTSKNHFLFSVFIYLFLGSAFEIAVMKFGFNIPEIIRYFWLMIFILMNIDYNSTKRFRKYFKERLKL